MTDEEWSEHVRNGEAFAGVGLALGAAGMFSHVQLFNPVASGVRIRLWVMEAFSVFGIARNQNVYRHDVALGAVSFFAGPENLLGGGAAPGAEIRIASLAALAGSRFWLILAGANRRRDYPPLDQSWGHDLDPGEGIHTASSGGGAFTFAGFMWAEVPV